MPWEGGGVWSEVTPGPTTYLGQGGLITNGDDGTVDFENIVAGTYTFEYTVGVEPCVRVGTVVVAVLNNSGADVEDEICTESDGAGTPILLFDYLDPGADTSGAWSGSGTLSPGYSFNGAPNLSTYNPALEPGPLPKSLVFNYTLPASPTCDNCRTTITFMVWFSCNDCPCNVNDSYGNDVELFTQLQTCWPDVPVGGTWEWIGAPTAPCSADFYPAGGGPTVNYPFIGGPVDISAMGYNPVFRSGTGCGDGVYQFKYTYLGGISDINPCDSTFFLNLNMIAA